MLIHSVYLQVFPCIQGLTTTAVSTARVVQKQCDKRLFCCWIVDSWQLLLWGSTKLTGEMAEVGDLSFLVSENASYSRCDAIIICLLNNVNNLGFLMQQQFM